MRSVRRTRRTVYFKQCTLNNVYMSDIVYKVYFVVQSLYRYIVQCALYTNHFSKENHRQIFDGNCTLG